MSVNGKERFLKGPQSKVWAHLSEGKDVVVTATEKKRRTETKIAGGKAIGGIVQEWK
jgi:hypothetical protein